MGKILRLRMQIDFADKKIIFLGKYVCLVSLCVGACLRPSVPGAFYFLIFLGSMTWWASYKNLQKSFAIVCRITLVVLFFHISALYAYQFQWPQEFLDSNSTYARQVKKSKTYAKTF